MNRKLELAKVLLVFIVSTMMLTHGIPKIYNFDGTIAWLQSVLEPTIFPGILAYGVFVGEVVAPVMLLLGVFARYAAAVIVINMLFVIYLVHMPELFSFSGGYPLELQMFFLFVSGALVLLLDNNEWKNRVELIKSLSKNS